MQPEQKHVINVLIVGLAVLLCATGLFRLGGIWEEHRQREAATALDANRYAAYKEVKEFFSTFECLLEPLGAPFDSERAVSIYHVPDGAQLTVSNVHQPACSVVYQRQIRFRTDYHALPVSISILQGYTDTRTATEAIIHFRPGSENEQVFYIKADGSNATPEQLRMLTEVLAWRGKWSCLQLKKYKF